MKAVVIALKKSFASVLSDDGCFATIKNNNYEIGQVIQMNNPIVKFTRKIAMFTASAAAFIILGVGTWAYATPYSYVSVDVNPSIEYTVNRFNRVLTVKAVNDDGEEIIQEISLDNLKNKTIEEALLKTVEQITTLGYFKGVTESGIIITTSNKDIEVADELASDLQLVIEEEIAENEADIIVEAYSVTLERVSEAKELGVTPGKLNLVEKLQASTTDPTTIDIEEWLARPVKEIMKATKDNRKAAVVTGAAISFIDNEEQKLQSKEEKAEKQDEKAKKAQEKAQENAEKSQEKATETTEKAQEKAQENAVKSQEKATETTEKVQEKAQENAKKSQEKATENAEKVQEKAQEKAEKSQKIATENAEKAQEKAQENAEKSQEIATENENKAQEKAEVSKNNNVDNSDNSANQDAEISDNKTAGQDKSTNKNNDNVEKSIYESNESNDENQNRDFTEDSVSPNSTANNSGNSDTKNSNSSGNYINDDDDGSFSKNGSRKQR